MKNDSAVRALERGLQILMCFDVDHQKLSLTEITIATNLSASTVSRLLSTLVNQGFLQKNSERKYTLGDNLFKLLELENYKSDLRSIALPMLKNLRDIFDETASLYVSQNDLRVCLESVQSRQPLRRTVEVGEALPLTRGAAGHALLAWIPYSKRKYLINNDINIDEKKLSVIRQTGYVINDGEQEKGVFAIASPIHNKHGQVVASIAISGPSNRFNNSVIEELVHAIKHNASLISQAIGYKNV